MSRQIKNWSLQVAPVIRIDDLVPNAAESEPVAKSFVKCHGWLGHLGERERRAETYN